MYTHTHTHRDELPVTVGAITTAGCLPPGFTPPSPPPPNIPPHLTAGNRKSCLSDLLQDSRYNVSPTHKLPVMGKVPPISALLTAPHQPNIYHKAPPRPPTVPHRSRVAAVLVSICIFT